MIWCTVRLQSLSWLILSSQLNQAALADSALCELFKVISRSDHKSSLAGWAELNMAAERPLASFSAIENDPGCWPRLIECRFSKTNKSGLLWGAFNSDHETQFVFQDVVPSFGQFNSSIYVYSFLFELKDRSRSCFQCDFVYKSNIF